MSNGFGPDEGPVLSLAVAQLAASLGVTPDPAATVEDTAGLLVERIVAVHGELVGIQRSLRQKAEAINAREREVAEREARVIAREKQLAALERLSSIATFEPAPAKRFGWLPRR